MKMTISVGRCLKRKTMLVWVKEYINKNFATCKSLCNLQELQASQNETSGLFRTLGFLCQTLREYRAFHGETLGDLWHFKEKIGLRQFWKLPGSLKFV